jgi:hypothetical protein
MAYVDGDKGQYIKELMETSDEEWRKGNKEYSISLLEKAWDELPEDKYVYDESFLIIWYILMSAIEINDIITMNKWVDEIFLCDLERGDTGEREYWAGKVAYANENFVKAKEYFLIANKKSKGRCFDEKDKKYIQLMNE